MTPDTQLTVSNLFDFEGKEIRVIEQDNDFWMIVADLTKAWNLHRNTLTDLISRNEWKFAGHYTTVAHNPCAGMIAVNETGMYLLMGAVHVNLVKNEKARETIKKFNQDWPKLVKAYRKGEILQSQIPANTKQLTLDTLNHQLDIADIAINRSGMPKEIAHAMAYVLTEELTKVNLRPYATYIEKQKPQQLLLPDGISQQDRAEYEKHHSLTKVAGYLKLPVDKVRNVLESLNIIYFENGIWHLTKTGEQYGKVFMVTPGYPYGTKQRAYIKYNPLCLDLLRKYFELELPKKVQE